MRLYLTPRPIRVTYTVPLIRPTICLSVSPARRPIFCLLGKHVLVNVCLCYISEVNVLHAFIFSTIAQPRKGLS